MALLGRTVKTGFYFGATLEIIERAKALRKNMTPAESYLWDQLRRKNINGYRFRRQHPISRFIVDFYCHASQLAIEIDGEVHGTPDQMERDENRTYELERLGIKVLRFSNRQVIEETSTVLKTIWLHFENKDSVNQSR